MRDNAKSESVMDCPVYSIDKRVSLYGDIDIAAYAAIFKKRGFVSIPNFLGSELLNAVRSECESITDCHGNDKNMLIKSTGDTPRQMRTVGQHILSKKSNFIPKIYSSAGLCDFISRIAGEEVFRAPWAPEEYVLSNLYRNGDTHGWHWDDYSYAFVLYLKAPDVEQGGFVQTCAGGSWDKENPKINETMLNNPIYTYRCNAGDAYLLDAKNLMHRVTPISRNGERLIINMTWANASDLSRDITHETNDVLFAT